MKKVFRSLLVVGAVGMCLSTTAFGQTGNCPIPAAGAGLGTGGAGLGAGFGGLGRIAGMLPPGLASRATLPAGLASRTTLPPGLTLGTSANPIR